MHLVALTALPIFVSMSWHKGFSACVRKSCDKSLTGASSSGVCSGSSGRLAPPHLTVSCSRAPMHSYGECFPHSSRPLVGSRSSACGKLRHAPRVSLNTTLFAGGLVRVCRKDHADASNASSPHHCAAVSLVNFPHSRLFHLPSLKSWMLSPTLWNVFK